MKRCIRYSIFAVGLLVAGIILGWRLAAPPAPRTSIAAATGTSQDPAAQETTHSSTPSFSENPEAGQTRDSPRLGVQAAALLHEMEQAEDPQLQDEALEHAVSSVKRVDLRETLEQLAAVEGDTARQLREGLVRRWAQMDPKAVGRWAVGLHSPLLLSEAVPQIAVAWAQADFSSAWAWANSLPEGETRQSAQLSAAYEESRFEPERALQAASNLPQTVGRDNLLAFAASQWAAFDPIAALAWAKQSPDLNLRETLYANILTAFAVQDASTAAGMVATGLRPGEAQNRAAVAIVQRWAQSSPSDAAGWISRFPESTLRQDSIQALLSVWAAQDAAAAAKWVNTLPGGSFRDSARLAYAESLDANRGGLPVLGSP